MITLKISLPKRPYDPVRGARRWVYRVVLDSGKQIGLTELATRLGVSYSTLFHEVECLGPGTHSHRFHECMAIAKRKNRRLAKTTKCLACNGRGRIPTP